MVEVLGSDGIDGDASHGAVGEAVHEKQIKALDGEKLGSPEVGRLFNSGTEVEGVEENPSCPPHQRGFRDSSAVGGCSTSNPQVVVIEEVKEVKEVRDVDLNGELVEKDELLENPVLGDELQNPVAERSSGGETQVFLHKVSSIVVEGLSKSTVYVNNDLEKQKDCISDDAVVSNPEAEMTVVCSTSIVKSVSIDTKCSQQAPDVVNDEDSNPEVDVTEAKPESLDIQTQPDIEEEVSVKDCGNSVPSEAEGIDTDACDESSVDKVHSYVEVDGGGVESHDNVLEVTCQLTEGIEDENPKILSDFVRDKQLKLEKSLDEGSVHDPEHDKADIAEVMEVVPQFSDAMMTSAGGEDTIEAEQTDSKADLAGKGNNLDTTTSGRKGLGSNSNEKTVNFKVNDLLVVGKDQQLKSEDCKDKSVTFDFAQLASDAGKETEVQDQATDVKEVKEQPVSRGDENNVDDFVDPVSLCQPVQLTVEGDVATMDVDVLPDQNPEVSPCSENDQILKAGTVCQIREINNQAYDKTEMDTGSIEIMNGDVVMQEMVAENQVTDAEHRLQGGCGVEFEKRGTEELNEQKSTEQAAQEAESSAQQARYELPTKIEGEFSVADLVWGKVRSHPWWPGQIFDPSDASEKAMKYHKKDCFLVAYFGDRTFAWNDASLLKPFSVHFSLMEKQGNSEAFQNAVDCALEEVSRRVELGLACPCIPKHAYDIIKFQVVENGGIQQESSIRDGVDKSASACSFEPGKLVEYVKALAQSPSGGADRLELVVAKAQLLALSCFTGFSQLPEFEDSEETSCPEDQLNLGGAMGNHNPVTEEQMISENQKRASHKREHNLRDMYPMRKERCLSELMEGTLDFSDGEYGSDGKATSKLISPTAAKKRKTFDSFADGMVIQDEEKSISLAKVSKSTTSSPRQSFKIGECIQRAATHLTGPSCIIKCNSEKAAVDGFGVSLDNMEDPQGGGMILLDELLSQLHLAAQDPFRGHSFSNIIVSFFSDFRDSVVPSQSSAMEKRVGRRKMPSHSIDGFTETFEFEDMNDSYWTDMAVENGSFELSNKDRIVHVALEPGNSVQSSRRPYSRKRYRDVNSELEAEALALMVEKRLASPAEIIMTFSTVNSVPSETSLNKMFKRFGPLKEPETMLDRESCRARVVYKKGSDAEVAYNSAGKFNIFGSLVVSYQLNFSPFEPFKAFYTPSFEGLEEATLYLQSQS